MQGSYESMKQLERDLNYEFSIYLLYTDFQPTVAGERLYDLLCRVYPDGKIPELTLQTTPQEEGLMIYDVLDGKYDDFLHAYAGDVSLFGRPVLMRLANEMNGDWCSYCAYHTCRDTDIYLEFYRYIFDIFIQEGTDNAIWVWNPNHRSFPDFKWNDELMYYPGDEYVNVIGLTAYNTGSYYKGETWSSFDELYRELYQRTLQRYARPMMITEFASNSVGGDKVQWINDMFSSLSDYPMIKAAVWWNSADWDYSGSEPVIARQYILEETQDTFNAFKDGLSHY